MQKIIFVRHGETDKNIDKKLHDYDDSEKLNNTGFEQIKKTTLRLIEFSPSIVYSSTESRAQESAKIISEDLKIPHKVVEGMQERNWGNFSGKKWTDIKVILDLLSLEERYNYKPPSGESWKEFETRLINSLSGIISESKGKTLVILTHGGTIRALMPYLLNLPREESFKYDPDNASISVFEYLGKNRFKKILVNDTSHLNRKFGR